MQKCAITFFSSLLSVWILLGFTSSNATAQPPHPNQPKANVILIIGDGMDDVQISIARNYLKGARGRLTLPGVVAKVFLFGDVEAAVRSQAQCTTRSRIL